MNWVLAIIIWAVIAALAIYLLWCSPWTARWPKRIRMVGGVVLLVALGVWGTVNVRGHYANAHPEIPETALRFVHPSSPALVIINRSGAIAREIKWSVALWNVSTPAELNPLPIPVAVFDFIRPGAASGPQSLFGLPTVRGRIKQGDELVGSASVVCPECARGHTYWLYIRYGEGGWYSGIPGVENGDVMVLPRITPEAIQGFKDHVFATVAESDRRKIGD